MMTPTVAMVMSRALRSSNQPQVTDPFASSRKWGQAIARDQRHEQEGVLVVSVVPKAWSVDELEHDHEG